MKVIELKEAFIVVFGDGANATFFSPGCINLIGEHTDYNGGHVFPVAIILGTYGAARKCDNQTLRLYPANSAGLGIIEVGLANLVFDKKDNWTDYPKGTIKFLQEAGHTIGTGFDLYVDENIPNGSDLSSSASLELLVRIIAEELFDLNLDRLDLAKTSKRTKNEFIGADSGVMGQFATDMGADEQTIYFDTDTLEYDFMPPGLGDDVVVIMNTNKRHGLADSKYNERRAKCKKAVEELNQVFDIKTLGELNLQAFDEYSYLVKDTSRLKRARHVAWENQRTLQTKGALIAGEPEKFNRLVNASHVSLEHDYGVTGIEFDTPVHTAWQQEGVLGARMAGVGFDGCSIAIITKDKVDKFTQNVGKAYTEIIGYVPASYIVEIAGGSRVLSRK